MKRATLLIYIILIFNLVQFGAILTLLVSGMGTFDAAWYTIAMILFVLINGFFLYRRKTIASILFIVWYILLSFTLVWGSSIWGLSFGLQFDLSLSLTIDSLVYGLKADAMSITMMFVSLFAFLALRVENRPKSGMKIGILGSGSVGESIAKLLDETEYQVFIGARQPEELVAKASQIGRQVQFGRPDEAAAFADVLILTTAFDELDELKPILESEYSGRVLIDTTNQSIDIEQQDFSTAGQPSSMLVQNLFPSFKVIKAFNTIYPPHLIEKPASTSIERMAVPLAGDTPAAIELVEQIIRNIDFEPYYTGTLEESSIMDRGQLLYNRPMTASQLNQVISEYKAKGNESS